MKQEKKFEKLPIVSSSDTFIIKITIFYLLQFSAYKKYNR
jgi:hypothetical protein